MRGSLTTAQNDRNLPAALAEFLSGGDEQGVAVDEAEDTPPASPGVAAASHMLPTLADLPIPKSVKVDDTWPPQMRELADHLGAYTTLLIIAEFGGQRLSINRDPARSPFLHIIEADDAQKLAWVWGGSRIVIPNARALLARVRRASVVSAARARTITIGMAARIIGSSRNYVTELVNGTREGFGVEPLDLAEARSRMLRRKADDLLVQMAVAGAPAWATAAIWASIVAATEAAHVGLRLFHDTRDAISSSDDLSETLA